jgi:hypothetical protein
LGQAQGGQQEQTGQGGQGAWRESGLALPIAIFVVTLVTIMLAAIFVRVEVDRRMAETTGSTVDAAALAHSGLQRYFGHYDTLGVEPPDGDSLRFNLTGGYADVVAMVLQNSADEGVPRIYAVRSTGRRIEPTQGADPQAVRTVAQFAQWNAAEMDPSAAFTAANGFNPPAGTPSTDIVIHGGDECSEFPTLPTALRLPDPDPPSPPGVWPPMNANGTPIQVAQETGMDWPAIVAGEFAPDYTTLINLNTWSSYLITGDAILNTPDGTGLLVVTGDLELGGAGAQWDGVVLVGGQIRFQGNYNIFSGVVISGLNYLLGDNPPPGEWPTDSRDLVIRFNSCFMRQALASVSGFTPLANAWIDNWAMY